MKLLLALLLSAPAFAQPPTPHPETKDAALERLAEDFTVRARIARNLARIIATKEAAVAFNLSAESYERAAELCRRSLDAKPAVTETAVVATTEGE